MSTNASPPMPIPALNQKSRRLIWRVFLLLSQSGVMMFT
jgi:hypothetical protein